MMTSKIPRSPRTPTSTERSSRLSVSNVRHPSPASSRSGQVVLAIKKKSRSRSSTPIRHISQVQRRSPSPAAFRSIGDSAGDESQEDKRDFIEKTESDNVTPTSNGSYHMEDEETVTMDEIIFQRYINEKRKYKKSECRNMLLQEELNDITQKFEEEVTDHENTRKEEAMKYEEQVKMTEALHTTIRNLQSQFSKQSMEHGEQITSIREEADKHALSIQEDFEQKIASLELRLGDMQSKYDSSQLMLRREVEAMDNLVKKKNEIEDESAQRLEMIEKEREKSNTMASQIEELQRRCSQNEQLSEERLRVANSELNELGEKLQFESEKAHDFSSELKLMSYDYVQTLEQLSSEQKRAEELGMELEKERKELTAQLKRNTLLSNQLEEMSRGYIEVDEMYTRERSSSELLTAATTTLKSELTAQQSRNRQLTDEITRLTGCLNEKEEYTKKLLGSSKSIFDELSVAKTKLEENKVDSMKLLEAHHDLQTKKESLDEKYDEQVKVVANLSNQLKESQEKYGALNDALEEEKTNGADALRKETEKSSSLSAELIDVKGSHEAQSALILSLEMNLKKHQDELTTVENTLKIATEKCETLEKKLEEERKEHQDGLRDIDEEAEFLRDDHKEMEKKYHALFDNLVETEEELKASRDAANALLEQLEAKEEDMLHSNNALREEIHSKDQSIENERITNERLRNDIDTMTQKHEIMYSNLVAAEERLLEAQDKSEQLLGSMKKKDEECHQLGILLQKERNRPHQRKLKVAKKMIHAEKERYKCLTDDMVAKEVMIKQAKEETDRIQDELQKTRDLLEIEKEKKASHSARAIQELHRQLDDERKDIKNEKETLRSMLKTEKGKVKSLTLRLKAIEGTSDTEEISESLAQHHELSETVRLLTEEKRKVEDELDARKQSEKELKEKMSALQEKFEEMLNSMETLTSYCSRLEEEKASLLGNGARHATSLDDETLTLDDNFSVTSFDTIQTEYSSSVFKSPTVPKIDEDSEHKG